MDIINATLPALKAALDKREISSLELVNHCLERIGKHDDKVKAFLYIDTDNARKEAKAYDEKRAGGHAVPSCAGIPIALKDLILTKDMPTTCASRMLENFYSPYDASVVTMLKNAGYINLGKLNMDEFAMGSSGESSYYKKTANPWDLSKVPGGSSSGSAAAVAAGLVPAALGSDTGGSIRQPASFCGICGLKPSYGSVSRFGAVAYASSLDQIGPMAKSVEDIAFLMDTIAQYDRHDSTFNLKDIPSYYKTLTLTGDRLEGVKLGVVKGQLSDGVDADVNARVSAAIDKFSELGAEIVEVDLPHARLSVQVYQMIANGEASSNLAKFDGVRFGYRADKTDLADMYAYSRSEGFGYEVKKRIMLGTYVLQERQYQDFYVRAMQLRRLIRQDYDRAFEKCDLIVGPTAATTAFGFGQAAANPLGMRLNDLFSMSLNLAGACGLSIPVGFDSAGLPVGLQLQGNMYADARLLSIAHTFQKATDWHNKIATVL